MKEKHEREILTIPATLKVILPERFACVRAPLRTLVYLVRLRIGCFQIVLRCRAPVLVWVAVDQIGIHRVEQRVHEEAAAIVADVVSVVEVVKACAVPVH